jgi:hypothetical protein
VHTVLREIAYPAEDRNRRKAADEVLKPFLYLLSTDSRGVSGKQFTVE